MYPRGVLDIGWRDLAAGFAATLRPPDAIETQFRLEEFWNSANPAAAGGSLACLSVRSGFDALLTALEFPKGDEVLVSAITIKDMILIIEAHGLVPVPVDLDMDTLSLSIESLERAVTPRSRALLVAHIFGSRMPLEPVAGRAHEHGMLLIEDCAQAYADRQDRGDPAADVSLFSFGPIKTNTALGGAMMRIADPDLLARTRVVQSRYPRQENRQFRSRVLKYVAIKAVSQPFVFGAFAAGCRVTGRSHDSVISAALRGFPGSQLIEKIRRQPSAALLSLLHRRLTTFDRRRIERRIRTAEEAISHMPSTARPGSCATTHTHWVFPIESADPAGLISRLWSRGFDATRGASSLAVVPPPGDRPEAEPVEARAAMSNLLYLPVSPLLGKRALAEMAHVVNEAAAEAMPNGRTDPEPAPVVVTGQRHEQAQVAQ